MDGQELVVCWRNRELQARMLCCQDGLGKMFEDCLRQMDAGVDLGEETYGLVSDWKWQTLLNQCLDP